VVNPGLRTAESGEFSGNPVSVRLRLTSKVIPCFSPASSLGLSPSDESAEVLVHPEMALVGQVESGQGSDVDRSLNVSDGTIVLDWIDDSHELLDSFGLFEDQCIKVKKFVTVIDPVKDNGTIRHI
jgi:hypothetical protein